MNEKSETINLGGRLHDDFDGENKDVYVENFGQEEIYVRICLDEYLEYVVNADVVTSENTILITKGAVKGETSTYVTHVFDAENATDDYWQWTTGGSTIYMPTFNKNKDSLEADINGTYKQNYADYKVYSIDSEAKANATYDNDINAVEDDNVFSTEETHYAAQTAEATLISMDEWSELAEDKKIGDYWVYDSDGWVYYAKPLEKGTATGLLLDKISPVKEMDDSYYYAINVVCQIITADDCGQEDNTGFFGAESASPSNKAMKLLKTIGVDVTIDDNTADE